MQDSNNSQNIKVFLAATSSDAQDIANMLIGVLRHAGMQVFWTDSATDFQHLHQQTTQLLQQTHCSVHIIGDTYDYNPQLDMSEAEYHYAQALAYSKQNPEYKIFVWRPAVYKQLPSDPRQRNFWFLILNNISENVIFATYESPIMFVEDIRAIMLSERPVQYEVKDTEIYLIYNEIDEQSALIIKDLLSDVAVVEDTSISLSSGVDYYEFIAQQIQKSILPVIYFKKASVWAGYFIKEIWRKIGGLSSGKTLLLVGDESIPENREVSFEAPNVKTIITSEELIPLEIKVELDKVKNAVSV